MQSLYRKAVQQRTKDYQNDLKALKESIVYIDASKAAAKFWYDLTGTAPDITISSGGRVIITIHMSHVKRNGTYPTRAYDLALLTEFIDGRMEGLCGFDNFSQTFDQSSTDLKWGMKNGMSRIAVYAYHGGRCTLKQVGTEVIEKPIYEMECK